jgi:hypothetical protein
MIISSNYAAQLNTYIPISSTKMSKDKNSKKGAKGESLLTPKEKDGSTRARGHISQQPN